MKRKEACVQQKLQFFLLCSSLFAQAEKIKSIQNGDVDNEQSAMEFSTILTCLVKFNADLNTLRCSNSRFLNETNGINQMNGLQQCLETRGVMDTIFDDSFPLLTIANNSMYEEGEVGQCFVSHVPDESNNICYIIDIKNLPNARNFYEDHPIALTKTPEIGEMFVYNCKDKILMRAIRTVSLEENSGKFSAHLIDIGSSIWIAADLKGQYEMTEKTKKIPPCAVKCYVMRIKTDENLVLFSLLHKKMYFRVVKNINNCLCVNLFDRDTNPFRKNNEIIGDMNFYKCFEYADFRKRRAYIPMDFETKFLATECKNYTETENNAMCKENGTEKLLTYDEYLRSKVKNPFLDNYEERTNLMSEYYMKSTDKDSKLNEHDEYDGCSVGNNFKNHYHNNVALENTEKEINIASGQLILRTIDESFCENSVVKIHLYTSLVQFLPKCHHNFRIHVTHIVDVEEFYGQIPSLFETKTLSLTELEWEMNTEKAVESYKEFVNAPAIEEFVVAKFTDNRFYRAKVINMYDQNNLKVFYVDFGNCANVNLTQIFKWDKRWNCLPAQAFHCRLDKIKRIKPLDFLAIQTFHMLALNKELDAMAVDIITDDELPTIVVRMTNNLGMDIADTLCEQNMAVYKKKTQRK